MRSLNKVGIELCLGLINVAKIREAYSWKHKETWCRITKIFTLHYGYWRMSIRQKKIEIRKIWCRHILWVSDKIRVFSFEFLMESKLSKIPKENLAGLELYWIFYSGSNTNMPGPINVTLNWSSHEQSLYLKFWMLTFKKKKLFLFGTRFILLGPKQTLFLSWIHLSYFFDKGVDIPLMLGAHSIIMIISIAAQGGHIA